MDILESLSVALGLAALSGVNLYLTVFATGMAVHFGWVVLPTQLQHLNVLGDPWIIGVAGVLYFLGFFADKIPWVDSANDAIHTLIRPLGGALLAVLALGDAHPVVTVVAALLAGGVALTAHAAKAGTRLAANTSPEPLSNVGLSLGEDALVLGGLGLVVWNPLLAVVVFTVLIGLVWYFLPRLLRGIRTTLWFAWRKLNLPSAGSEQAAALVMKIPHQCETALQRAVAGHATPNLSVPCVSGSGPRLPRNRFGWLAGFPDGGLYFVASGWRGPVVVEVPVRSLQPEREAGFLAERLILRPAAGKAFAFYFERGHRLLADRVAAHLRSARNDKPSEVKEPALAG